MHMGLVKCKRCELRCRKVFKTVNKIMLCLYIYNYMVLVEVCYKKKLLLKHIAILWSYYIYITLVPCSNFVVYTLTACSNTISWHLSLPFLQCCAVHGFWSGTYKLHIYSFAMHGSLSLSCIEHIYMCRKYSGVQSTQTVITQHY